MFLEIVETEYFKRVLLIFIPLAVLVLIVKYSRYLISINHHAFVPSNWTKLDKNIGNNSNLALSRVERNYDRVISAALVVAVMQFVIVKPFVASSRVGFDIYEVVESSDCS